MLKRLLIAGGLLLMAGVAVLGYLFFKEPTEASRPIVAIPLVRATTTTSPIATGVQTPSPEGAGAGQQATTEPAPAAGEPVLFEIVQDRSEARFVINEVLQGAPKEVVGKTNQVAGQLAVDPTDPSKSQVGVIQVNARTLTTDNNMRNRAVKNRILLTDQFEYVTFNPRELVGLPSRAEVGQSYTFQMVGDLTITDITREVTFDVTVTARSETELEGQAATTIFYRDFQLAIPNAPLVDEVEESVRLELSFVAAPA